MSEEQKQETENSEVKTAARSAVERGDAIREDIRDITLTALSQRHLDSEKLRQVIHAVVEGASIGAESKGADVKEALSESIKGMDEALATSAEASKLAIEETAGHLKDFGKQDLKRALDDLLTLEDMFLDTIKNVANASSKMMQDTLNNLEQHTRHSGTEAGKRSRDVAETLNQKLGKTLRETTSSGTDAALTVGAHLSQAAAGFLEAIAETLKPKEKSGSQSDKE